MVTHADIQEGLKRKQFFLYYQPKLSLVSGQIVGVEALIRWIKEDGTVISPNAFIPVAEKFACIKEITSQIFPLLVDDLKLLGNNNQLTFSFNATAQDFEDADLTNQILDLATVNGMAPQSFEVEITETMALNAGPDLFANVLRLCSAGVGLTMDDFGTGYSSMDTLSRWPFTTIKLDQGIVSRMLRSERNATIVRSSIRMGHELQINVVAEGVETVEQYNFLAEAGCETVQGYFISRPLPIDNFISFYNNTDFVSSIPVGLVHMAILDHIQWRRQMAIYAIRLANLPPDSKLRKANGYPPLSCTECSLGRWYFDAGQFFKDDAVFIAMNEPHCKLHETGSKLIDLVRGGARLKELTPVLQELKYWSIELIRHLENLEDIGITSIYLPTSVDGM